MSVSTNQLVKVFAANNSLNCKANGSLKKQGRKNNVNEKFFPNQALQSSVM